MTTRRRFSGPVLISGMALSILLLGVPGLSAQSSTLDEVEAAIQEGAFQEARDGLEAWWESADGADRRDRQHAIWLRALLTVDPSQAELDYRRLVVEYPGGPWSDQALFRLAQGAEARGDGAAAGEYLEILLRDYPGSPLRVEARTRLERLAAQPAPAPEEEAPPAEPTPAPEEEILPAEPTPTLEEELSPPEPAPAPEREARAEEPEDAPEVADTRGDFTVQLGAFSRREGAQSLMERGAARGLQLRMVQVEGSPLYRVRMDTFPTREAAERAVERLEELGMEALVSADRDRERPAGR